MTTTDTVIPTDPIATAAEKAPEVDPSAIRPLASYLADHLTGLHRIGFAFVQIKAAAQDNVITAECTRRRFDGPDCAAAIPITITIGPPTTTDPAPLPEEINAWSQALMDLWADSNTGPGAAA